MGSHFRHRPRFLRPPCNPGRSDFPSPVLTSARTLFISSGLPDPPRSSSGDSHPPRARTGLLAPSSRLLRCTSSSSVSGCMQCFGTAECPEPLCPTLRSERPRGTPRRALPLLLRSYGLMRQTACLRVPRLSLQPPGLCRLSSLPAGRRPFPTLSLFPLCRRLDPYPAVSPRCTCPLLPGEHRPCATGNALGRRDYPCHATSSGSRISGLQSFASLQAPTLARPLDCTHLGVCAPGGRAVYTTHSPEQLPVQGCGIATCPTWAIDTAGLSPAGLQSCRLLLPASGSRTDFTWGIQRRRLCSSSTPRLRCTSSYVKRAVDDGNL